jgi:hypothetical protein
MAEANRPKLIDPQCGRTPDQIDVYVSYAEYEGITPDEYVWREEGTLNMENGHFLCDDCYIKAGMPTSPTGWKCP